MLKSDLLKILNDIAPLDTQEEWDNSGMQINLGHKDVKRILTCLEISNEVIEEAKANKCDFILAHHPLYFFPMKTVDADNLSGRYTLDLIEAGIEVYSSHTPFDKCPTGNNWYILSKLGCTDIRPEFEDIGFVGEAPHICDDAACRFMTLEDVLGMLKQELVLADGEIRYHGDLNTPVRRVGICTGAGSDFMQQAWNMGCDVYITGDTKYHEVTLARELGKCIIDAGHAGTEENFADNMGDQLMNALEKEITAGELEIIISEVKHNPYRYF